MTKINPPQKAVIEVDGEQYNAKYCGRGQFSKVYRVGDRVVYYTRGDCGKEVLAQFQYDRMMHLPELVRHENITTGRGIWYVFSSPYYRNVTSKDTSAWKLMKSIINAVGYCYRKVGMGENAHTMQQIVNCVDSFEGKYKLPRSIMNALQEIVNVASNCGEGVGFDLHKKNFGVNEYGVLIFRDPIYVRN